MYFQFNCYRISNDLHNLKTDELDFVFRASAAHAIYIYFYEFLVRVWKLIWAVGVSIRDAQRRQISTISERWTQWIRWIREKNTIANRTGIPTTSQSNEIAATKWTIRKSFDTHGRKTLQNDVLTLKWHRFWTYSVFHKILLSRRQHQQKLWNNRSFVNFIPPKLLLLSCTCCAQFKPSTASTLFHYVHHYPVARLSNNHTFLQSFHNKQFKSWTIFDLIFILSIGLFIAFQYWKDKC